MTKYGRFKVIDEEQDISVAWCGNMFRGQGTDGKRIKVACTRLDGHAGPCAWLYANQHPDVWDGEYQEYWEPEEDDA